MFRLPDPRLPYYKLYNCMKEISFYTEIHNQQYIGKVLLLTFTICAFETINRLSMQRLKFHLSYAQSRFPGRIQPTRPGWGRYRITAKTDSKWTGIRKWPRRRQCSEPVLLRLQTTSPTSLYRGMPLMCWFRSTSSRSPRRKRQGCRLWKTGARSY